MSLRTLIITIAICLIATIPAMSAPSIGVGDSTGFHFIGYGDSDTSSLDLSAPPPCPFSLGDKSVLTIPSEDTSDPISLPISSPRPTPNPVPEPSGLLALMSGLVGIAGIIRRRIG